MRRGRPRTWLSPFTPAGGWTSDGNGRSYDQSNYHWYLFQQNQEVCTEELVTPQGGAPTGFDL